MPTVVFFPREEEEANKIAGRRGTWKRKELKKLWGQKERRKV